MKKLIILSTLSALLLLVLSSSLMAQSQKESKSKQFSSAVGTYHNFSNPSFATTGILSLNFRYSPKAIWSVGLDMGYSSVGGFKPSSWMLFSQVTCKLYPINQNRFRLIPALGIGAAHGSFKEEGKSTGVVVMGAIDLQYQLLPNTICGVEYRLMRSNKKEFNLHLLGIKLGFSF